MTNLSGDELGIDIAPDIEVKECLHCGRCTKACPCGCIGENGKPKSECLSAITQKKNELNNFIKTNCDFCLFSLNGLFSCFCNVNRGTFSLKKLNDNEHNMQIELIYHNKKHKYNDIEIDSYYINVLI